MRRSSILLALLLVTTAAVASVVFTSSGVVNVKPISPPITAQSWDCPCQCSWSQGSSGFTASLTAYTMSTVDGYTLTVPFALFSASVSGTLSVLFNQNPSLTGAYINGTPAYPSPASLSLTAGSHLLIQRLVFNTPITSSITLSGSYNDTPASGVIFMYSFTESISPPSANIMNLLNGLQSFYVSHVYQGDNNGKPTGSWPAYYPPSTAGQYWNPASSSINQTVLEFNPAQSYTQGVMYWSQRYSGSSVTIEVITTYSNGTNPPADGIVIYLFLNPSTWSASSRYNYTIPYSAVTVWSPVMGEVIVPQSKSSYLVVQWDPYWQVGSTASGATGQWNVWVVSNTRGNNPSASPSPSPNLGNSYSGWDGVGGGYFKPNPGDYICITVTYNPSSNTLTGTAYDLNTGQSANLTLSLGRYFKAPAAGTYVFGVGSSTGGSYANWGTVFINT